MVPSHVTFHYHTAAVTCAKTCTCKEDTSCSYQDMKGSVVNVKAKYTCLNRARSVTHHKRLGLERLLLGYASSFGPREEL